MNKTPVLDPSELTSITDDILQSVKMAIRAEMNYQKSTNCGRKFGITGEVGEILACSECGLHLVKHPRTTGFDAVDDSGLRIQIKTRRSEVAETPDINGRLGSFSKHPFDYALMVLLSHDYSVLEIWKSPASRLKSVVKKHKRCNPTIRQFKKAAERVYVVQISEKGN